jgi:hypothetical protein
VTRLRTRIVRRRFIIIGLVVIRLRSIAFRTEPDEAAPLVEEPLLLSPGCGLIERLATLIGTLLAASLTAPERAAEILTTSVAGMREESNPAMAAPHRTATQIRTVSQNHVKRKVILTNKRIGAFALVPIFREMEDLFES